MTARLIATQEAAIPPAKRAERLYAGVAVLGALVIVLIVLLGLRYREQTTATTEAAEIAAVQRVNLVASQVHDSFAAILLKAKVTHDIARLVTQAHMAGDRAAEQNLRRYLEPDSGSLTYETAQISAVTLSGQVLWSNLPFRPDAVAVSDREHVIVFNQRPELEEFVGRPVVGRASGILSVQSTQAVRGADGAIQALTVLGMRADTLATLAAGMALREGDLLALVRDDGVILMRSDMDHLGEVVPQWRYRAATPAGRPGMAALAPATAIGPSWFSDDERYFAARNFPDSRLTLVVGGLRAPVLAQVVAANRVLWTSTVLLDVAIVGFMLAGGIALYVFGRTARANTYAASQQQSEVWFHSVIDGMSHGMLVFDGLSDGDPRVSFANRAAGEIFGLRPEALMGLDVSTLLSDAAAAKARANVAAIMRGEAPEPLAYEVVRPDGIRVWIRSEAVVSRIPGATDRMRVIATVQNVTDEHEQATTLAEARARLDHILRIIPGVFYQTVSCRDGPGRMMFVSESMQALFGVAAAEVMNGDFVPRYMRGAVRDVRRKAAADAGPGSVAVAEYPLEFNGKRFWVRDVMRRVELPDGGAETTGFIADISEEHSIAEARRAADAHLQAMSFLGPGVMYHARVAENGIEILDIMGEAERLTADVRQEDGQPATLAWMLDREDRRAALYALPEDSTTRLDYDLALADGTVRWVRNAVRVDVRGSQAVEIVGYLVDVTQERQDLLRRQQMATLLTLGEMATGIAHELNQPLAVISFASENALAQLAKPQANPSVVKGKLERILAQAHRAAHMVQHMRVFARSVATPLAPVTWANVIRGALDVLSSKLRGMQMAIDVAEDLPAVMGAQIALEQVIVALISNAADAYSSARPDAVAMVAITGLTDGQDVVIRVADRAGGILPEALPRIFEPFFTTKPVGKGIGLGLSVALSAVSDMGGVLSASNDGDGAMFEIRMPIAPSALGT